MTMLGVIAKANADQLDYDVDFTRWLPAGDTITTATATVTPAYDAVNNPSGVQVPSLQIASPIVKVWTNGGVVGQTYTINVTASTAGGRIKELCFQLRIQDC
jgi:hypothetical protein